MTGLTIFGAAGRLGRVLARRAVQAGHTVTLVARPGHGIEDHVGAADTVVADISTSDQLAGLMSGRDAIINVAGNADNPEAFCVLVDRLVAALESVPSDLRPHAWFLGGVGILEIGETGLRAIDLPLFPRRFRSHDQNLKRLQRSSVPWSLLCPGKLVDRPGVGGAAMQASVDRLPVEIPAHARHLPAPLLLALVMRRLPSISLAFDDVADFLIDHLAARDEFLRKRVGLAPVAS